MEPGRGVLELLEGQGDEPACRAGAALFDVKARRRELDQALEVPAPGARGAEPDRLPDLVRLEVASRTEGLEPAREPLGVGR